MNSKELRESGLLEGANAKAMADTKRMIGVFGWRETELAAIRILDAQWDRPWDPVDPLIFSVNNDDGLSLAGFRELKRTGLIDHNNIPTREFWRRVHGR